MVDIRPGKPAYYQAVFRASDFDSNLKYDSTSSAVPTKLELVTDEFPPVHLVAASH
jgi:hypothetical protein